MAGALKRVASGLGKKAAEASLKAEKTARDRAIIEAGKASKRGFLNPSKDPERYYHGTTEDISEFRPGERGFVSLTRDPDFASEYAGSIDEGSPNVMPVRVQTRNPFDYENPEHIEAVLARYKKPESVSLDQVKDQLELGNWNFIEDKNIQQAIKDAGFDAFYMKEQGVKNLGVFDPKRIKSDIGMQGNYDITTPEITQAKGGAVDQDLINWHKKMAEGKATGGTIKKIAGAAEKAAKKSQYKRIEPEVRKREGEYGVQRLERIFDEAPYAAGRFEDQALLSALAGGDNANTLALMSPSDFRYLAAPLDKEYMSGTTTKGDLYDLPPMLTSEYIDYLARVGKGKGFEDIPFLNFAEQKGTRNLGVTGHEGRHRMRAMEQLGDEKSLVRMIPRASVREDLPRRSREEFLRAMEEKYGNPLMVDPEDYESTIINMRKPIKPFAQGGSVDQYQKAQAQQAQRSSDIQSYKEGKIGADELVKHFPGLTATMVEAQLNPEGMKAGGEVKMQAGGDPYAEIRRQLAAGVPVQGPIAEQIMREEREGRERQARERTKRVSELPFSEKFGGGYEAARTVQSILGQEILKPFVGLFGGEKKIEELEAGTPLPKSEAGIEYLTRFGEFMGPIGKFIEMSMIPDTPLTELTPVSYLPGLGTQISQMAGKAAKKVEQAIPEPIKNLPVGLSVEPVGKPITEAIKPQESVKAKEVVKAPADDLGFYSTMEKAALNIERKQGSGDAFLNDLRNGGVSKEELKYSGMEDYLKSQKSVSREDVQDFARNNRYELEEVEYRGGEIDESEFSFGRGEVVDDNDWIMSQADDIANDFDSYYPGRRQEIEEAEMAKYSADELEDPVILERIRDDVDEQIRNLAYDDANVMYYENPYYSFSNGAGYEIFGNDDIGYTVRSPNGLTIGNREFRNLEGAEGAARQHAQENGLLDEGTTQYHAYQLDGGKNYREVLLKHHVSTGPRLTGKESRRLVELTDKRRSFISGNRPDPITPEEELELKDLQAKQKLANAGLEYTEGGHWGDEPDVLLHLRLQDRTTTDGKPMLYVDELQSDWHQRGSAWGYRSQETVDKLQELKPEMDRLSKELYATVDKAGIRAAEIRKPFEDEFYKQNNRLPSIREVEEFRDKDPIWKALQTEAKEKGEVVKKLREEYNALEVAANIPDAPLKENWHETGIKRAIAYAVRNGYDRIGFSASPAQIKRWGTQEVAWEKAPKIEFTKENFAKYVRENADTNLSGRDLDEYIDATWENPEAVNALNKRFINGFKSLTEKPEGWNVAATEQRGGMAGRINLEAEARARGLLKTATDRVTSQEELRRIVDSVSRQLSPMQIDRITKKIWGQMQKQDRGLSAPREEGFKFFYDEKVKNFLDKYAKKMGAEFYESKTKTGRGVSESGGYADVTEPVYVIELTPKLKDSAMKGQSYKKGGLVEVPKGWRYKGSRPCKDFKDQKFACGGRVKKDKALMAWAKEQKMSRGGIAGAIARVPKAAEKASKRMSRAEAEAAGLWHPISETKLAKPIGEYKIKVVEEGANMLPKKVISPEEMQGGVAIPLAGDRSAAGKIVEEIEGIPMSVVLEGGGDFMRRNPGKAWASDKGVLSTIAKRIEMARESGAPIYGVHTSMSPLSVDFNTMATETLLNRLDIRSLRKKDIKEFDEAVRSVKGQQGKLKAPNFPGLADPDLREKLMKGSGGQRDAFVKTMAKDKFAKLGFPEVAPSRLAITETELLNVPRGASGYTIAKMDPEARIVQETGHKSYPYDLLGDYVGGFESLLPVEVMYPSHFEAKRLLGSTPTGAHKSLELSPPIQYLDQNWLDNAMKYLEMQKKLTGRKKGGLAQAKEQ